MNLLQLNTLYLLITFFNLMCLKLPDISSVYLQDLNQTVWLLVYEGYILVIKKDMRGYALPICL